METNTLNGKVDISNDDYHAGPGISKSHLDVIANASPLHYWYKYINPNREPSAPTEAMKLGTAVHAAILEPESFEKEFIVSPEFNRRTKDGKAMYEQFVTENAGKTVITPEVRETCLILRDRVHNHPLAGGLLQDGNAEQSFYAQDPDSGELMKCRFDYLQSSGFAAIDLKTTKDASETEFGKSAANLRYDIAAAWYFNVLEVLYGTIPQHWIWLAVEKEPPYAIGVYFAPRDMIERAREAMFRDFNRIIECKRNNDWPDYAVEAMELKLPGWVKR